MREISQANEALKSVKNTTLSSLTKVRILARKIKLRKQNIDIVESELSLINNNIEKNSEQTIYLEERLKLLKEQYKNSVIYTFKAKNSLNYLSFLFLSSDFSDMMNRLYYMNNYRNYSKQKAKNIELTKIKLNTTIDDLVVQKDSKSKKLEYLKSQYKTLAAEKREKDKIVRSLKRKQSVLLSSIKQKRKQWQSIRRQIKSIILKQIEKDRAIEAKKSAGIKNKKSKSKSKEFVPKYQTVYDKKFTQLFVANKGKMAPPISAPLKMGYGEHPIYKGSSIKYNNTGYTYQAKSGQQIYSVAEGVIVNIQTVVGGKMIAIRHGQYYSIYLPVNNLLVKEGDIVKLRQVLGTFGGRNGRENDFEFQLLKQLQFLNPKYWLR